MFWYAAILTVALVVALGIISVIRLKADKNKKIKKETSNQLQELSMLTGSLAHEIKNPLSIIKVNLKLMGENLDDKETGRARRKVEVLKQETSRLENILENFLRYIGEPELKRENVDLNKLIDELVEFYSPQAWKNSVTIRFAPYPKLLKCYIDADKIKQVLLNLFINAQKAMEQGGELIVYIHKEKKYAKIYINDTGRGIESEKIDKIFEAFYTDGSGGTGIGLATAKKIITAHNGTIAVKSELNKGSSFIIKLPLADENDK